MRTDNYLFKQISVFLSCFNIVKGVMHPAEIEKSLNEFVSAWENRTPPDSLPIQLREEFFDSLTYYMKLGYPDSKFRDILPKDYKGPKAVVTDVALIDDNDLKQRDEKAYQPVIDTMDSKIALFRRSMKALLLPQDIRGLTTATLHFLFQSYGENIICLHEKAADVLVEYAQQIITPSPIYLVEKDENSFEDILRINDTDDILAEDNVTTNITYYLLHRAGLQNAQLAIK